MYSSSETSSSSSSSSEEASSSSVSSFELLTRGGRGLVLGGGRLSRHRVDVRMIDFAHTTFSSRRGNSTLHHGPDCGFLTGLDSLKRLLLEILAEDSEQ
jgi:hypothetical protein